MKQLFVLTILLIAVLVANSVFAADFQKGLEAAQNGDYSAAVREWKPLAERGDPDAQYYLGAFYQVGRGIQKNIKQALNLYTSAAEQGHADARFALGAMYHIGQDVKQDYKQAVKWYSLAAEQGMPEAQFNLGKMYDIGSDANKESKKETRQGSADRNVRRQQGNLDAIS